MKRTKVAGSLNKYGFRQADTVYSIDGLCPAIICNADRIGHSVNIMEEEDCIKFLSSHGIVEGHEGDCVSLTFVMSLVAIPHTPIMRGIMKTITTCCDHDIGVIVDD